MKDKKKQDFNKILMNIYVLRSDLK